LALDFTTAYLMGASIRSRDLTWAKGRINTVLESVFQLPFKFPGSALNKALAARKELVELLWEDNQDDVSSFVRKVDRVTISWMQGTSMWWYLAGGMSYL
jgi:hypothetical protein